MVRNYTLIEEMKYSLVNHHFDQSRSKLLLGTYLLPERIVVFFFFFLACPVVLFLLNESSLEQ